MKSRSQIIIIAAAALVVIGLIIVLISSEDSGSTAANQTSTSTANATTALVEPAQPSVEGTAMPNIAGTTPTTITATPSDESTGALPASETELTPTATMTVRELEILDEVRQINPQAVQSTDQCDEIFKTEPWCSIYQVVKLITRPEWEQLFPGAQFYLAEYKRFGQDDDPPRTIHFLIVEQDGQRYNAQTYDQLMIANHVELTADNRELIARGWALMTIPEYLLDEVRFTSWEPSNEPLYAGYEVYDLKGWTRLGGVDMYWSFAFAGGKYRLVTIGPVVLQALVGDYTGTANDVTIPDSNSFNFFLVR